MPFDQSSLIHRQQWFPGGPKIPKNLNCLKKRKKSSKTQKLKNVYANNSDSPFDLRSLINQEAWFPPCFVGQNQPKKKKNGDFLPLPNKNVEI